MLNFTIEITWTIYWKSNYENGLLQIDTIVSHIRQVYDFYSQIFFMDIKNFPLWFTPYWFECKNLIIPHIFPFMETLRLLLAIVIHSRKSVLSISVSEGLIIGCLLKYHYLFWGKVPIIFMPWFQFILILSWVFESNLRWRQWHFFVCILQPGQME